MTSFKTTITIPANGQITLDSLPFQAGERVEIHVESTPTKQKIQNRFPLRGSTYKYDRPFDPASPLEDWAVYQ